MSDSEFVLDDLPDYVRASMELRDRWLKNASTAGFEFIFSDVTAWAPGQVVTVAFLGGSDALRNDVAKATSQITDACNIKLDFWTDASRTSFRTWSESDTQYNGQIRVSFDMGGYWSLVGQDSINASIAPDGAPVGGRPNQRSLNLGGFAQQRPASWQGTTRHEFMHAIGFHHEHQNMRGPAEVEFRWEDDPGYIPTTNANGSFIPDGAGRRPGIYTFLAGPPNRWSKGKIDSNLRTTDNPNVVASAFDNASVMLYRFPALFYRHNPSPAAPSGDGQDLSEGDKRGLRLLYPFQEVRAVDNLLDRRSNLAKVAEAPVSAGLESVGGGGAEPEFLQGIRAALKNNTR
ncbi:MAG: hypothetical protein U0271_43920 [Polyangiaceae bacterium]